MASLNVNTSELIALTAKLEKLHRSAFPSAVRNTLNNAAFDTKKLIPKAAGRKFTVRQKNLFSAFTAVDKAQGFDVNKMSSSTGIQRKSGRDQLAEGLAQQEVGGTVKSRKLIPHDKARISGSRSKKLRSKYRFNRIDIATRGSKKRGAKYIMRKRGSKGTVFEAQKNKLVPVFVYQLNPNKRVKSNNYIESAGKIAAKRLPDNYKKNAEFQFNKALKK